MAKCLMETDGRLGSCMKDRVPWRVPWLTGERVTMLGSRS